MGIIGGTAVSVTGHTPDISVTQVNYFTINKELLSQERWQAILQCKQNFLQNAEEDPRKHPYMNQEVAASWIRSRNMGVNPYTVVTSPNLNLERLTKVLDEHRLLIDITNSLSKPFKDLLFACGYILYLFDKTGVILLNEGDWGNFPISPDHDSRTGIVADETSEGTTAHELCIRLKRPVQLLGPEHYCVAFQNRIASAAPIKDENEEVNAALVLLSPPLLNPPGENILENLCLHSFGLITSMAVAVETQLKLKKAISDFYDAKEEADNLNHLLQVSKDKLVTVHNTLNATLAFIDEGIITIDRAGKIIYINQEGIRILKLRPEEMGNRNISEFLGNDSVVTALTEQGENITNEESVCVYIHRQPYQVSIRPIINQYTKKLDVAVLRLNSFEKAPVQFNHRPGGVANYTFDDIIGDNKDFRKTVALAQRFACTPENIMLVGESGTGKELFAQAIHNIYRPQGPFMAVNCAAMPRELIESELFGYEGGSFSGAERSGRPGKIELSHGGTLFLDEIGDMPLALQAVLLRTLEDRQVMRVGGRRYKKVDFKLIAATNKDLYKMVRENQFREDLYFRLSVLTLNIPPLRERGNDTEILSTFFIKNYCQKQGWKIPQVSPAVQKIINEYEWPGNARQLQNAMVYAVNTAQGDMIKPENLPNYIILDTCPIKVGEKMNIHGKMSEMLSLDKLEKAAIETALLHTNNSVPIAAEMLGISRSNLYRKLKEYNIGH
jgi:transcriptional regulator with PAS, ATPase and Fis domain